MGEQSCCCCSGRIWDELWGALCSASGVNCLEFPLGFLAVEIGADLMLLGGFFSVAAAAAVRKEGEPWAVLAVQGLRCWGLQDPAQSRANPAQTSQEQILSKPALQGGSRNLENQIAQGVVEQEKGFCGLQCWLSRAWESLGVEQGKGSHKGLSLGLE